MIPDLSSKLTVDSCICAYKFQSTLHFFLFAKTGLLKSFCLPLVLTKSMIFFLDYKKCVIIIWEKLGNLISIMHFLKAKKTLPNSYVMEKVFTATAHR